MDFMLILNQNCSAHYPQGSIGLVFLPTTVVGLGAEVGKYTRSMNPI